MVIKLPACEAILVQRKKLNIKELKSSISKTTSHLLRLRLVEIIFMENEGVGEDISQ